MSQSPNPFVPIIMLTGHTHVDRVLQARDAGVTEFLAKPISINAILSRLVAIVDDHQYQGPERRSESYAANTSVDAVA